MGLSVNVRKLFNGLLSWLIVLKSQSNNKINSILWSDKIMIEEDDCFCLALIIFESYKLSLMKMTASNGETVKPFTPHSIQHCKNVQDITDTFIKKQNKWQLPLHKQQGEFRRVFKEIDEINDDDLNRQVSSDALDASLNSVVKYPKDDASITKWEYLLLYYCAWSHDIGMMQVISKAYYNLKMVEIPSKDEIRKNHDKISQHMFQIYVTNICDALLNNKKAREDILSTNIDINNGLLQSINIGLNESRIKITEYLEAEENSLDFESFFRSVIHIVNLISLYHRRAENIDECPSVRIIHTSHSKITIRTKLLAALFRLSDALNVDRTRFSRSEFERYKSLVDFDTESRFHWIKSFVVSSIDLLDEDHTIKIQIDVPYSEGVDIRKAEWKGRIFNLANFIKDDLGEDVNSVAKILFDNNFPLYLDVNCEFQSIPSLEYEDELINVLNLMNVSSSPNSSQVIQAVATSLGGIIPILENSSKDERDDFIQRYKISLEETLNKRACHVSLRKIVSLLNVVSSNEYTDSPLINSENRGGHITLLKCLRGAIESQLRLVEWSAANNLSTEMTEVIRDCNHIVLYGFSSTVASLLSSATNINRISPKIHILECRTKTKVSKTNQLIYHDAYRYAKYLRENQNYESEINIYPDAYIGGLVKRLTKNSGGDLDREIIFLLGTNGVSLDGDVVHSIGYHTLSDVARAEGLPIYIVADTLKVSDMKEHPSERKGVWLTTDKQTNEWFARNKIKLSNPIEDVVKDENMSSNIVILDECEILNMADEESKCKMDTYKEKFFKGFSRELLTTFVSEKMKKHYDKTLGVKSKIEKNDFFWFSAQGYLLTKSLSNNVFIIAEEDKRKSYANYEEEVGKPNIKDSDLDDLRSMVNQIMNDSLRWLVQNS